MIDYFMFDGYCKRAEFWIIQFLMIFLHVVLFLLASSTTLTAGIDYGFLQAFLILVAIASIVLQWSTAARRVRDIGMNPYWCLLTIVPYLGIVWFFAIGLLPSYKRD